MRSDAQRRRLVAESLGVGNPGNNARDLPIQADPRHDCQIELKVEDIRAYEHNPRRANNAKFAEIKESIRSSGIRNPFTVTRRPGEEHFIVEAGGNTRLLAIQQLWAETGDPRFRKLTTLFRPWHSESHVLTAHLIENEQRGEMTFWDKASGVVALKARIEAEKGRTLSLRQLEEEMKGLGLPVNTATLAHYLFATERLRTLGEVVVDLSGLDVKTMQPRLNAMKRYAQTRASLAEADLYATVFEPVFRQLVDQYCQVQAFSAAEVCRACEEALVRQLGEPVAQVRLALDALTRPPQTASETPSADAGANRPVQSVTMVPSTVGNPSRSGSDVSTANAGTVVSGRQVQTGHALPSNDRNPGVLVRLTERIRIFAGLAGIGEYLRPNAAAPLGYYMDALPIAADGNSISPSREQAWWLLALLAGQFGHTPSVAVPDEPPEGGARTADKAGRALCNPPPPFAFDAAFLAWLVNAHDETASAFWNVLALVRESRFSVLRCQTIDEPMPAGTADA